MDQSRAAARVSGGGVDWAENWRRTVEERRVVIEGLANQGPQDDFWKRRAPDFVRLNRELDPARDPLALLLAEELRGDRTLLDVGAGAGRYTLPLAEVAVSVTAVEPAEPLRSHLQAEVVARGLENVAVVPTAWEDADVEPHDVVLCSHVVYPIADVATFIQKLDASAHRVCYMAMRVDQMSRPYAPLWREVWGADPPREPGFLDLFNLLYALGLRAEVQLTPFRDWLSFDTLEDAQERARRLLFLPPDSHEHDDTIRRFLEGALVAQKGRLVWWFGLQAAIVSWRRS